MSLKVSQETFKDIYFHRNSQENTCVWVSFLIKVLAWGLKFIKKRPGWKLIRRSVGLGTQPRYEAAGEHRVENVKKRSD